MNNNSSFNSHSSSGKAGPSRHEDVTKTLKDAYFCREGVFKVQICKRNELNEIVPAIIKLLQNGSAKYIIIKARGLAIELALQASQLARDSLSGVSSTIWFGLRTPQMSHGQVLTHPRFARPYPMIFVTLSTQALD